MAVVFSPTSILLTVTVDGRSVDVPVGASALDAINAAGVSVPQLCKDPDQKARGACRTCLVQIEGVRGFPASCTTPCSAGMQISVSAPEVERIRRGVLALTNEMQPVPSVDTSNPFFVLDMQKSILSARCVGTGADVQHIGAIALLARGASMK